MKTEDGVRLSPRLTRGCGVTEESLNAITERVIGCALKVSNTLGCGFLERVYENALAHELRKAGVPFTQQEALPVRYDGVVVGDFATDLRVEGQVIVELKATEDHHDVFAAQCLNYLKATGMPICLLLNFGRPQLGIKRFRR